MTAGEYFVWSTHREENVDSDENFADLIKSLNCLCDFYKKKIIFSAHPRTMRKIAILPEGSLNELVLVMKPLDFFDYVQLQKNTFCTISDSGTITE